MVVVRNRADALYRAAIECCRQHDRAAKLSDTEEPELEHKHLDALCKMCDRALIEIADLYSAAAANVIPSRDEEWWHKANALWHASREYERRHADCDKRTQKLGSHSAEKLGELAMQYDLEASALLALRLAVATYRSCCPDAELSERPQTFVA